jgi:hypothetical protein
LAEASCSVTRSSGRGRFQRVLGRQHVEVGLGHAHDQVLLGLGELGFGNRLLQLALLVGFPAVPAEQRLLQRDRVGLGGGGAFVALHGRERIVRVDDRPFVPRCLVVLGTRDIAGDADGRQQPRTPLGDAFASRRGGSAGAGIGGVVRQCLLVHLEQIGRLCLERKSAGQQHGDEGFLHYFLHRSHLKVLGKDAGRFNTSASMVDLHGPGVYSARQITNFFETVPFQEGCDLHAARAVVAHADDVAVVIQFAHADRNQVHRDLGRAGDLAGLEFPVFPTSSSRGCWRDASASQAASSGAVMCCIPASFRT